MQYKTRSMYVFWVMNMLLSSLEFALYFHTLCILW